MQAHHILSRDGVKRSGFSKELEKRGYDINHLKNLVFIPSTLQGACHLEVQPHRGNHTAEFFEEDDETMHPKTYHALIKQMVKTAFLKGHLKDECKGSVKVQKVMNELSEKVLDLIQNGQAKLTNVAEHFDHDSKTGCAGQDSISGFKVADCPKKRDHSKDGISFPKNKKPYQLKPGE
jgi:hypothetical protein